MEPVTPRPLTDLVAALRAAGIGVQASPPVGEQRVDRLTADSRAVSSGTVFAALKGAAVDGHRFIGQAIQSGAAAVIGEEPHPLSTDTESGSGTAGDDARPSGDAPVYLRVEESREAFAAAAQWFRDHPAAALRLVGVTGTNGKTTTSTLVYHLVRALGREAGVIGTVEVRVGDQAVPATLTTPDALRLAGLLADMKRAGVDVCAMEVSSHALDQRRTFGLDFGVAVFTNLTHDHLDYHATPEAYLQAKRRLFAALKPGATALMGIDDPAWEPMAAGTEARVVTYGFAPGADVRVEVLENAVTGLKLRLTESPEAFGTEGFSAEGAMRLVGAFNALNLAAAYGTARALGFPATAAFRALKACPPVAGRFEQIAFERGTVVVVDYAHTPDALENVLETARAVLPPGAALWAVFGAGGDRDAAKRPLMAAVAERLADRVVLTSDNPRTEPPEAILQDLKGGLERPEAAAVIPRRRAAIAHAAAHAAPGDVVVIAGKGHETYQILGTEKTHFDDREEARRAFAEHHGAAVVDNGDLSTSPHAPASAG